MHETRIFDQENIAKKILFRTVTGNNFFLGLIHPSNAEAIIIQSTRIQRFLKIILTMSCCYSLECSHWLLSYEYPHTLGFSHFSVLLHHLVLAKLATSSIRVKHSNLTTQATFIKFIFSTRFDVYCVNVY